MKIERDHHNDEDVSTTPCNFTGAVDSATQSLSSIVISESTYFITSADEVRSSASKASTSDRMALADLSNTARLTNYKNCQVPEVSLQSISMKADIVNHIICVKDILLESDLDTLNDFDDDEVIETVNKRKRRLSLGSGAITTNLNCNINLAVQHERWAKRRNELLSFFIESTSDQPPVPPPCVEAEPASVLTSILTSSNFWDEFVSMDQEVNNCDLYFFL